MAKIIVGVIVVLLNGALPFLDTLIEELVPMTLYAEQYMYTITGFDWTRDIFQLFFYLGVSLIVLKFLKKGFEVYVLWTEGDADADPLLLVTNFFKAMAITLSFPTMYGWLASAIEEITYKILGLLNEGLSADLTTLLLLAGSAGLFTAILSLIAIIAFLFLYIQFLQRGLEILILRIGLPLAAAGLLDSDKGVFAPYMQKFFQTAFTIIVQISLARLGLGLLVQAHPLWGLAAMLLAIRTPRYLQEFLIMSGGGGGNLVGNVYQGAQVVRLLRGVLK